MPFLLCCPNQSKYIIIIIIVLQECASFYFWSPAEVPRMQGSAGFCSLVAIFHDLDHPTFANLWQSCHILVLLSTSFSVILSFVPSTSKSSAFTGPLSSSILFTCPNHHNLFSLRNSSNLTTPVFSQIFSLFILSFKGSHILFATFSFLWSSASFHLPFSMPNIQHHK